MFRVSMKVGTDTCLTIRHCKFEAVDTFNYLEVTIGKTGKGRAEHRILKDNQSFGVHRNLLRSK